MSSPAGASPAVPSPVQTPTLHISRVLRHYKRPDVQEKMLAAASGREIGLRFGTGGFGKRPDVLNFSGDIMAAVAQGATSFHTSEERWHNPLDIRTEMTRREQDELRSGWDLVLDIDCPIFEYSRIAAELCVAVLRDHGVEPAVKFSGNKGFHIAVPWESFPSSIGNKQTSRLFPEAPRIIASYIKELIAEPLAGRIMEMDGIDGVKAKTGKSFAELTVKQEGMDVLNTDAFLEIDTVLLASRHLYRMPYSLHEKSGLVSTPINPDKVGKFKREMAAIERFKVSDFDFPGTGTPMQAEVLLKAAYERDSFNKAAASSLLQQAGQTGEWKPIGAKMPLETFPPCIHFILNGIEDGRKRAVFVLLNFLTTAGWNEQEVRSLLAEWNQKNPEPLREQLIEGQVRYHFANLGGDERFPGTGSSGGADAGGSATGPGAGLGAGPGNSGYEIRPPPNCANEGYYPSMGACHPDDICRTWHVKNPASYVRIRKRQMQRAGIMAGEGKSQEGKEALQEGQEEKGSTEQKEGEQNADGKNLDGAGSASAAGDGVQVNDGTKGTTVGKKGADGVKKSKRARKPSRKPRGKQPKGAADGNDVPDATVLAMNTDGNRSD